ncbi:MAG: SpoIIE family protein phosphatase, partial [Thermostichales cyanobacterium DRC_bins_46]
LTPRDLQKYYQHIMTEKGLSSTLALYHHRIIHQALDYAVKMDMLEKNPADYVDPPRKRSYQPSIWDEKIVKKALEIFKETNIRIPVLLAIYTGMRIGEIAALKWDDIHLEQGYITVNKTLMKINGQTYIKEKAENKNSYRIVAISNQVTEELYKALRKEIDTGRRIQQEFLPQSEEIPQHPHWELATVFRPARDIAGDFYDIFPLPGDCIGLVIGDVSDKGVGSSLFMALFRSLIRVFAEQSVVMDQRVLTETLDPVRDPDFNRRFYELAFDSPLKAVGKTHEYMFRNHSTACMFATLFFGVLDPETGRLRYINAGHEAPMVVKDGVIVQRLGSTGVAVGFPVLETFTIAEVQLQPGQQLIAYTDGITDAKDSQGRRFTEERLLHLIQAEPQEHVGEMLERIEEAILNHIGSASPFDDITMLGVRYL